MKNKLNLGAGNSICNPAEYINHDIRKHREEIAMCFDLNEKEWMKDVETMLEPDTFKEIRAYDVLEHLNNPINFMDNCWELLQEEGVLDLKVCGWQNPNFYVDITHKKAYDIKSFDYFDPTTEIGKEYSYYTDKKWSILKKNYDRRKNILIKLTPIK